jgi:hypothetical protein
MGAAGAVGTSSKSINAPSLMWDVVFRYGVIVEMQEIRRFEVLGVYRTSSTRRLGTGCGRNSFAGFSDLCFGHRGIINDVEWWLTWLNREKKVVVRT